MGIVLSVLNGWRGRWARGEVVSALSFNCRVYVSGFLQIAHRKFGVLGKDDIIPL